MTKTIAHRYAKRAAARRRAIRRRAAAWKRQARRAVTLMLVAGGMLGGSAGIAQAQTGGMGMAGGLGQAAMAPTGGLVNRAVTRLQDLEANGPGWLYYGINAADRGLGYNGSYMTLGGYIPYAEDDLGGLWAADLRGHFSEYGGFFSNVGAVRKQFIGGTLLGVGVYWDYDGDQNQYELRGIPCGTSQFGQFGHSYNQVGVSGEWLTDYGNLRSNGYIPVGTTAYTAGAPNSPFYQNFVMAQYGLDAALAGADLEVGAYVPGLSDWAGMVSVGGYTLGNERYNWSNGPQRGQDVVPFFGGVYTRLDMTFSKNWDFSLQYNNDSFFDSTGFARLTYRMGGSRRRNVPDQMEQPMMRNEHIVRAHQTPIVAENPSTGTPWRVIHVDNSVTTAGNGTAESPFSTLAAGNTAATNPYDIVLVAVGRGPYDTTNSLNTTFSPLAANQYLVGNGAPFLIPTVCSGDINIATAPTGTPILTNPNGASINITDGLVVNNFNIQNSAIGIVGTGNLSSPARGSLVTNVAITGNGTPGQQGVFIDNATGVATFRKTSISGMSNGAVVVDGGDPVIDFAEGTITNTTGQILLVNNTTGGSVTLTAQQGQPFTDTGDGILVENAAGDVNVTGANITSKKDGIKVVNSSGIQSFNTISIDAAGGTGFAGVNLQNNTGASQFNNLTVKTDTAPGFLAVNANTVDVTGNSSVTTTNGPAVSMTGVADAGVTFTTISSSNSPTNGVLLDDVAGAFAASASLTVTNATEDAFVVRNSPSLVLTTPVTTVSSTAGNGIVLQNNSVDATKVSLGQVKVTTTAGNGLVASAAGVTTSGGSIDATGGASIQATGSDLNVTLGTASSTNSTGAGLSLSQSQGSVQIATTTVSAPTGNGINATDNLAGFTADFGATTVSGIKNGGIGVNLTNSTVPVPPTEYSFGTLSVTTLNGAGLVTKNAGVVSFASPATITAAGGAAIDLENTQGVTAGVAGFTFLSLASTDSVSNGIRLNNLNSNLTVQGSTTISGAAGPSLLITDNTGAPATDSILFNTVEITNRKNIGMQIDGIYGQVQITSLNIDNANNVAGSAVLIDNTTNPGDPTGTGSGRVYLNGGTISGAQNNAIEVNNALARITGMTITGFQGQGILATAGAGQEATVQMTNSTITSVVGVDGLSLQASGGGIVNGTVKSSSFNVPSNAINAVVSDAASTINLNATGNIQTTAYVLNNVAAGGTLNISQPNTATLSAENGGVVVNTPGAGAITTGATPPVPNPTP